MIEFSTPALPTQTWSPGWTSADYQEVTETFLCLSSFHATPQPSDNTWAEQQTPSREQKSFFSCLVDVYTGTLLHKAVRISPPFYLLQLKGLYSQLSQGNNFRLQTGKYELPCPTKPFQKLWFLPAVVREQHGVNWKTKTAALRKATNRTDTCTAFTSQSSCKGGIGTLRTKPTDLNSIVGWPLQIKEKLLQCPRSSAAFE